MKKYIKAVFVDMDGTLIDTNIANNAAYEHALAYYLPHFKLPVTTRITFQFIKKNIADEILCQNIKKLKDELYCHYLNRTYLNKILYERLLAYSNYHYDIYLVTKASCTRVEQLLREHCCSHVLDKVFYCRKFNNKYEYVLGQTNICPKQVLVFENEEGEIKLATQAHIPLENIVKIVL